MKPLCLFGLMLAAGVCGVCSAESTNKLAIHLATNSVSQASIINGTARPEGIRLVPEAIISDRDLLAYDPSNHSFRLTAEATARVHEVCRKRLQTPFVLLAGGERIYVGVFTSPLSSISADVPSITLWFSERDTNSFRIDRGYPAPSASAPEPDPRDDARILQAVRALFPKR